MDIAFEHRNSLLLLYVLIFILGAEFVRLIFKQMKNRIKLLLVLILVSIGTIAILSDIAEKRIQQEEMKNTAIDFCTYCYYHKIKEPTEDTYKEYQKLYGPHGLFQEYNLKK